MDTKADVSNPSILQGVPKIQWYQETAMATKRTWGLREHGWFSWGNEI